MNNEKNILAIPGHFQISPSKKFILKIVEVTVEEILYRKFNILNTKEQMVFESEELFDIRHNTWFLWDSSDNVWVYSGDVGTYIWEEKDSKWVKTHYLKSNSQPPDFLVNKYPKLFSGKSNK